MERVWLNHVIIKAPSRQEGAKYYITIPVALVSKPTEGKKEQPLGEGGERNACSCASFSSFSYSFVSLNMKDSWLVMRNWRFRIRNSKETIRVPFWSHLLGFIAGLFASVLPTSCVVLPPSFPAFLIFISSFGIMEGEND